MTTAGGKGGKRHVVGIDATDPVDTLAFLAHWKAQLGANWDNLLDAAMADKGKVTTFAGGARMRLDEGKTPIFRTTTDAIHDKTLGGQRYTNTAVMPFGPIPGMEHGRFLEQDAMTAGRYYLREFLQAPGADAKAGLNTDGIGAVADVVLVSAHQRGGVIYGDHRTGSDAFFHMRFAALDNLKFLGPAWLVTSSCNVCATDLIESWTRLMQGEEGTLRGVLGYSGRFADAAGSVAYSLKFVNLLAKGRTFVEAWGESVEGNPVFQDIWAAICRPGAEADTIASLEAGVAPVTDPWTLNLVTRKDVTKLDAPKRKFDVAWMRKQRVTWATRLDKGNLLREGDKVEILVGGRGHVFDAGNVVKLHLMCRRVDYPVLFDLREMFVVRGGLNTTPAKVTTSRAKASINRMRPALARPPASFDAFHNLWTI